MKILIISYNPLCLFNNGGKSLVSIFSSFKSNELIQFYIHNVLPDDEWCSSFFRLTEFDLLNIFKKKNINRYLVSPNKKSITKQDHSFYVSSLKHRSFKLLIRDLIWSVFKWNNAQLKLWINKNSPDVIFSDTGDSSFLYKIAMKLSKQYNKPLIGYFGDDYYSLKAEKNEFFKRYQLYQLRKTIKLFTETCDKLIFINHSFAKYYINQFNLNLSKVLTIFNGSNFNFEEQKIKLVNNNGFRVLSYIGNLSLSRGDNLITIGKALDSINKEENKNHVLLIYSKNINNFSDKCKGIKSINYKGFIPGHEVYEAIMSSDIIIHTESFEESNIEKAKFSLSTKIADSLSSGKCLLAYGPSNVASIEYLIEENCAYVITSSSDLTRQLKILLNDDQKILSIGQKGKKTALKNHDSYKNSQTLYKEMCSLIK